MTSPATRAEAFHTPRTPTAVVALAGPRQQGVGDSSFYNGGSLLETPVHQQQPQGFQYHHHPPTQQRPSSSEYHQREAACSNADDAFRSSSFTWPPAGATGCSHYYNQQQQQPLNKFQVADVLQRVAGMTLTGQEEHVAREAMEQSSTEAARASHAGGDLSTPYSTSTMTDGRELLQARENVAPTAPNAFQTPLQKRASPEANKSSHCQAADAAAPAQDLISMVLQTPLSSLSRNVLMQPQPGKQSQAPFHQHHQPDVDLSSSDRSNDIPHSLVRNAPLLPSSPELSSSEEGSFYLNRGERRQVQQMEFHSRLLQTNEELFLDIDSNENEFTMDFDTFMDTTSTREDNMNELPGVRPHGPASAAANLAFPALPDDINQDDNGNRFGRLPNLQHFPPPMFSPVSNFSSVPADLNLLALQFQRQEQQVDSRDAANSSNRLPPRRSESQPSMYGLDYDHDHQQHPFRRHDHQHQLVLQRHPEMEEQLMLSPQPPPRPPPPMPLMTSPSPDAPRRKLAMRKGDAMLLSMTNLTPFQL